MSLLDWTRSETISKPSSIEVGWKSLADGQPRKQSLTSTDISTSVSEYQSFPYTDSSGVRQSQDVVVRKEDVRTTTRARVNLEYVSERLKYGLGLPPGSDVERSVTTYEYRVSSDGPKLVREVTTVYFSGVALAGQLQGVLYAWSNPGNPSSYQYYDPPAGEFISHQTIAEYDEAKGKDGRDYTRTKTSRWICAANNSESKGSFVKWMKALKDSNLISAGAVGAAVLAYTDLIFEGTEIQVNIGRAPVPAKPSDAELAGSEVTNGTNIPPGATPSEVFGNDLGWASYVPPGTDWQDYNNDSDGDGVPDWAPFVPDAFEDYNVDTDSDGIPDWAAYVPPAVDWQDFDQDTNNDGIPDWAAYVPPSVDWQDYDLDSNGDGVPDWAAYVPPAVDWQDVNTDTNNDGVPDWASFLPPGVNWEDFVTDPDDPFNTAIDTNNDGIPDWASNLPSGNWQDFVTDPDDPFNTAIDSNNDGIPDWADNLPSGNWQDYVTDPTDWENTAIDSNGDGVPDWADNTPIGWEEFDSDTTFSNPEPEVSNEKSITGQVVFDGQSYNDGSATVTATYDMPFAPDDYFYYDKGIRKLYRSNSRAAAEKFGKTEAALDIGHAFGQNIVTNFDLIPTLDLAPIYIRLAGIEGAFLLDAPSYAWGPEGMVVSSDLLLIGVTGYDGASAPATSWLRLPVAPSSIGPAGATTVEASPVKANSINIPGGFDVRNLASVFVALPTNGVDVFKEWRSNTSLVPPTLTLEREAIASGPSLLAVEREYALTTGTDVEAIAAGPVIDFVWVTVVTPPAAAVTAAGLAPGVSTGARVAVPAPAIGLDAVPPLVVSGASVQVPVVGVSVTGLVPETVGRLKTQVFVPAAGVTMAGVAPLVASGASVAVPAGGVTVAGVVPSVAITVVDPSFSSVQLLLHMDGANGSTTFTDNSSAARAITVTGNAQISTAQSKFGGAAALFDGNIDYIRATASTGLQFSDDFTIELWAYPLGIGDCVIGSSGTDSNTQVFRLNNGGSGRLAFYLNGTQVFSSTAAGITANTWQHLAICRSGSSTRMFVNGTQVGSTNTTWTGTFRMDVIGTFFFNGSRYTSPAIDFNGYIDELRITKGVARYTSNFTPPTAPFPDA